MNEDTHTGRVFAVGFRAGRKWAVDIIRREAERWEQPSIRERMEGIANLIEKLPGEK